MKRCARRSSPLPRVFPPLPEDIVFAIFKQIPLDELDLIGACASVSKIWYGVARWVCHEHLLHFARRAKQGQFGDIRSLAPHIRAMVGCLQLSCMGQSLVDDFSKRQIADRMAESANRTIAKEGGLSFSASARMALQLLTGGHGHFLPIYENLIRAACTHHQHRKSRTTVITLRDIEVGARVCCVTRSY